MTEIRSGCRPTNRDDQRTFLDRSHVWQALTGFPSVPAAEVALAYLRSISHPITGRILKLHKTNS